MTEPEKLAFATISTELHNQVASLEANHVTENMTETVAIRAQLDAIDALLPE